MSSEQFKHKLREKFKEAEITPSADLWAQIEKEVQGNADKKGGFWFFLGDGLFLTLLFLAYFFLSHDPTHSPAPASASLAASSDLSPSTSQAEPSAPESTPVELPPSPNDAPTASRVSPPAISLSSSSRLASMAMNQANYLAAPSLEEIRLSSPLIGKGIAIPSEALFLRQPLLISPLEVPFPSLTSTLAVRESWEDMIPLANKGRWAWEAAYTYLGGITGSGQSIITVEGGTLDIQGNGRELDIGQNEEDLALDFPVPMAANAPVGGSSTYTITHALGTHKWSVGGSYLLTNNLFLETGLNFHLSEIGSIRIGEGEGSPTDNVVLGSPVRRIILSESEQFQQRTISIPVGIGLQLGRGRLSGRLSGGIQFEGVFNHAAEELYTLLEAENANFSQPPLPNDSDNYPEEGLIHQNQAYLSGRLLYLLGDGLHLQAGAQFFYLTNFDPSAQIINGYDIQGGVSLGLIWIPSRTRIFKPKNP
ncbi:MAG: hypothetical protein AAF655_19170 [Bacteroidota bacterium]